MKPLIFLTLLTAFSCELSAQQIALIVREKFAQPIKGKPSKVTSYQSIHEEAKPAFTSKSETLYDSLGRVQSSTTYDNNGKVNYRREQIYDTVHNRVWATITIIRHKEETYIDTNFNYYDDKGFLIRQVNKIKDSSAVVEYTNDEHGLPVSAISYAPDGKVWCIESAKYDLKKNTFTVNVEYKPKGKTRKVVYKLDFTKPSRYGSRKNEKYNEQGNCISYESLTSNGKTIEHTAEYTYDPKGNWISSVQYRMYPVSFGGKQFKVTESRYSREIEYFE